jgi:hypothetical protein
VDWAAGEEEEEEEAAEQRTFPEFSARVLEEMRELGGEVFPKLNWSSPKVSRWLASISSHGQDASWVAMGSSLKCGNLSQLYLLLKVLIVFLQG